MKSLIILLSLISLPAAAFDLKGVEVGHTADLVQIEAQFHSKCKSDYCYEGATTIALEPATVMPELFGDQLCAVTAFFSPSSYDAISTALRTRYGNPTRKIETNPRKQLMLEQWISKEGDIMTLTRYLDVAQGSLNIRSHAQVHRDEERQESASKDL